MIVELYVFDHYLECMVVFSLSTYPIGSMELVYLLMQPQNYPFMKVHIHSSHGSVMGYGKSPFDREMFPSNVVFPILSIKTHQNRRRFPWEFRKARLEAEMEMLGIFYPKFSWIWMIP